MVLAGSQVVDAAVIVEGNHMPICVVRLSRAGVKIGIPKVKMPQPHCECRVAKHTTQSVPKLLGRTHLFFLEVAEAFEDGADYQGEGYGGVFEDFG